MKDWGVSEQGTAQKQERPLGETKFRRDVSTVFMAEFLSEQQLATVGILHLDAPTSSFTWIRDLASICRASAYI